MSNDRCGGIGGPHIFRVNLEKLSIQVTPCDDFEFNLLETIDTLYDAASVIPVRDVKPGIASVLLPPSHAIILRMGGEFELYVDGVYTSTAALGPIVGYPPIDFVTSLFENRGLVIAFVDTILVVMRISGSKIAVLSQKNFGIKYSVVPWNENQIALWRECTLQIVTIHDDGKVEDVKSWIHDGSFFLLRHQFVGDRKTRRYLIDASYVYCFSPEKMDMEVSWISVADFLLVDTKKKSLAYSYPTHVLETEELYWIEDINHHELHLAEVTDETPIYLDTDSLSLSTEKIHLYQKILKLPPSEHQFDEVAQVLALDNLPGYFIWHGIERAYLIDIKAVTMKVLHRAEFNYHWSFPVTQGVIQRKFNDRLHNLQLFRVGMRWNPREAEALPTIIKDALLPIRLTQKFRSDNVWSRIPDDVLNDIFDLAVSDWN